MRLVNNLLKMFRTEKKGKFTDLIAYIKTIKNLELTGQSDKNRKDNKGSISLFLNR
ncbi:hypothetical protein PSF70_03810 [Methanosarcina mazei]|nr:hypothetical protein PSF70_03810 [Methanosarcina mazei]